MRVVSLRNAHLYADIVPEVGGGLARLDLARDGQRLAVLRGLDPSAQSATPGQLACFPLVPWSNRLSPEGFEFEGRAVRPAPNRAGEPCPIHGHGWQHAWKVVDRSDTHVTLSMDHRDDATFSYHSQLRYRLQGSALHVDLEVRNDGPLAMPFGLGLHPWMPRDDDVVLCAPAHVAGWDFTESTPLPAGAVDNVFSGWNGAAQIRWPGKGITLDITANMNYFILYAPVGGAFFCIEPVDHLINAHNLPGGPVANGLTVLAPGQSLGRSVRFACGLSARLSAL
jgi:aldose 1-epimerase